MLFRTQEVDSRRVCINGVLYWCNVFALHCMQQGVHIKAVCQRDTGVSVELILISDMEMGRCWRSDKCFSAAGKTC